MLRFLGALGMGGEWALGVALVMELWPNASRAWLAGLIGAFGNLGYTHLRRDRPRAEPHRAGQLARLAHVGRAARRLGRRADREPATGGC